MWNKISRRLLPVIVCSLVVGTIYLTYIYFIGIPRTQARHAYNEAQVAFASGKISVGVSKLEQAYAIWPEDYIREELASFKSILD